MRVILLDNIEEEDLIDKIYLSARTCYSPLDSEGLIEESSKKSKADKLKLIKKVTSSGHTSVLEHVSLTYLISGISRSCSHQLVRNRIASYSQASQRYIDFSNHYFPYITPPAIKANESLNKEYDLIMEQLKNFYDRAVNAGIKPEDARFVLPNAACTNISMTMNIRELVHVCGLRLCTRAQWEIRKMFEELATETSRKYPFLYSMLVPNCEQLGYCPEANGSCHKYPTLEEVLGQYKPE